MAETCSVNLWINEERYDRLNKIGLTNGDGFIQFLFQNIGHN